jgi:hypothetical protein
MRKKQNITVSGSVADRFSGLVQRVAKAGFDRTGLFHESANCRKAKTVGFRVSPIWGLAKTVGFTFPQFGDWQIIDDSFKF